MSLSARLLRNPIAMVVAVVVAINVSVVVLQRLTGAPSGPASSSYATAPEGLAAYHDLVAGSGRRVTRFRSPLAELEPDAAATAVVLDAPSLSAADARALADFVRAGGRLIAGGSGDQPWLKGVLADPPQWAGGGVAEARPLTPVPEVKGVASARAAGLGYWADSNSSLPALGRAYKSIVNVATEGPGRVVLVADPSFLQNRLLDEADNAALGLALAGEGSVLFAENAHGYAEATGVAALPERWLVALILAVAAGLVFVWARGRRLGPPEPGDRILPPPRRAYAEALGRVLARTGDSAAGVRPVQEAARARLARRWDLSPDAPESELVAAARGSGLPEGQARAIFADPEGPADVLAAGRALAHIEGSRARTDAARTDAG